MRWLSGSPLSTKFAWNQHSVGTFAGVLRSLCDLSTISGCANKFCRFTNLISKGDFNIHWYDVSSQYKTIISQFNAAKTWQWVLLLSIFSLRWQIQLRAITPASGLEVTRIPCNFFSKLWTFSIFCSLHYKRVQTDMCRKCTNTGYSTTDYILLPRCQTWRLFREYLMFSFVDLFTILFKIQLELSAQ